MIELTDRTVGIAKESSGVFVVMLYAKWCPICTGMSYYLDCLADRHGFTAGKVDLNANARTLNEHVPTKIPYFIVYNNGVQVDLAQGKVNLEELIRPLL